MRILHASDFHSRREWFEWLAAEAKNHDLVCYTGDFLDMLGEQPLGAQITWITSWLKNFPGPLLWCAGNHDTDGGRPPVSSGRWLDELPGARAFGRDGRVVKGEHAFVRVDSRGPNPDFRAGDIVLSHFPPNGWQTALSAGGQDYGDFDLGVALQHPSGAPWLILSGHVHNSANWQERRGTTWSFNPGVNDKCQVPNHILIDTGKSRAVWICNEAMAGTVKLGQGGRTLIV